MNYPKERRAAPEKRKRSVKARSLANLLALTLLANLLPMAASSQTLGSEGGQGSQSVQVAAQVATQEVAIYQDSVVDENDTRPLEQGHSIKRELSGEQRHNYLIRLNAEQFVKVLIDQQSIDVTAQISGPDGKRILEFDSERWPHGQEQAPLVAEASGDYRLVVQSKKGAAAGRYEIRIEEMRVATENDYALQKARKQNDEALRLQRAGKYEEALPLAESAIEIRQRILGPDHRDVAIAINSLAIIYSYKGEYAVAESLFQRALAIREKALEPGHPDLAASLNNLALLYWSKSEYSKAEPLFLRSLEIWEKALGPEHSDIAYPLNNLALLYNNRGEYAAAEPLYQRVLAIREKTLGPENPLFAMSLNNLANLYCNKGDYAKAEPLYQRALVISEKVLGPEHPDVAIHLNNLAILYSDVEDYAKAEALYRRALAIREKSPGKEHPLFASTLGHLANIYLKRGEYAAAEPLYQRALAIVEKALDPEHTDVAFCLSNLGTLYSIKGDYAAADPLLRRALAIWEKALGPNHPRIADALNSMATLHLKKGDITQAITFQARANVISERNLAFNLATGSERQKLAYLALLSRQTDLTLSLHSRSAPNDPQALSLAFTTLLRRKGRGLDAMTNMIASLRRRATSQDQDLFDQLAEARSQLAVLILRESDSVKPKTYQARLKPLEERVERLEAELSARSAEFRAQSQPVTLSAVQSAIPADSALIEFVTYTPRKSWTEERQPPRYLAYLLTSQGQPRWVDLGDAAPIERAVDAWRQSLRENGVDVKQLGRAVDKLVMRPVRSLLQAESSQIRRLLIAPDGSLNLIPFAALVDEENRYLIERYAISFLTSGRDLLRLHNSQPSKSAPLVMANPLFGRTVSVAARGLRKSGDEAGDQRKPQSDQTRIFFRPLPGTKSEALAIKAVLPEASLLLEQQATEAALKRVKAPRILHIATHGFFLRDQEGQGTETQNTPGHDQLRFFDLQFGRMSARIDNPLLRSGLALSGANRGKNGDDDGLLTALEMAGLDLWGTKLVVLSACDTGLGEIKNGEGVQGLRRALVLAGSESQVISLWAIPDESTKEVIIPYYQALRRGEGRGEGLRQVQLQMLRSKERHHPFYWAAFIQSGEWASLDGR